MKKSENKNTKDNVLKEIFGTIKFDEPVEKMMNKIDKLLYNHERIDMKKGKA